MTPENKKVSKLGFVTPTLNCANPKPQAMRDGAGPLPQGLRLRVFKLEVFRFRVWGVVAS